MPVDPLYKFTLAKRVEQAETLLVQKPDPPILKPRRMVCAGNECTFEDEPGDHA